MSAIVKTNNSNMQIVDSSNVRIHRPVAEFEKENQVRCMGRSQALLTIVNLVVLDTSSLPPRFSSTSTGTVSACALIRCERLSPPCGLRRQLLFFCHPRARALPPGVSFNCRSSTPEFADQRQFWRKRPQVHA